MWYHAFFASKALHTSLAPPYEIRDIRNIEADIQYNEEKNIMTDTHAPDLLKLHKNTIIQLNIKHRYLKVWLMIFCVLGD